MGSAVNAVDVDRDAIGRELDELAGGVEASTGPDASAPPGDVSPAPEAVNWDEALAGAMEMFCFVIAPNWAFTDDEKQLIVSQGARVIEAFWPNLRLEEKWLLLCVFILSVSSIVMKRYDAEAGEFIPLRKPSKPKEANKDSSAQKGAVERDAGAGESSPPPSGSAEVPAVPLARVSG